MTTFQILKQGFGDDLVVDVFLVTPSDAGIALTRPVLSLAHRLIPINPGVPVTGLSSPVHRFEALGSAIECPDLDYLQAQIEGILTCENPYTSQAAKATAIHARSYTEYFLEHKDDEALEEFKPPGLYL